MKVLVSCWISVILVLCKLAYIHTVFGIIGASELKVMLCTHSQDLPLTVVIDIASPPSLCLPDSASNIPLYAFFGVRLWFYTCIPQQCYRNKFIEFCVSVKITLHHVKWSLTVHGQ